MSSFARGRRLAAFGLAAVFAFVVPAHPARAGTTGALSGQVADAKGTPIAGASVKISAPSQTAVVQTDARGHFAFLSLEPDTYDVTATKNGFAPSSYPGVTIFADQTLTLSVVLQEKNLKNIASVTSQSANSLVKSGTTASVYSVNAATQTQLQGSGGGYNLDSAYSAIYAQPGVSSYIGNYGFGQVFYIRGSSYSQVGYEYDGVPVNRAFDNYNANSLSSLGSAETEVYTGGSPASGGSATLGGYINQVIKTGTYPGYADATLGIGTPSFYHKVDVEVGGSTPDRLFTYYVGMRGVNNYVPAFTNDDANSINPTGNSPYGFQGFSFDAPLTIYNDFVAVSTARGPWSNCRNGVAPAGSSYLGAFADEQMTGSTAPVAACNNYTPLAASFQTGYGTQLTDRENIVNLHFGIPHKHDAGKDDIQILYDNYASLGSSWANLNENGGTPFINSWLAPYTGSGKSGFINHVFSWFGGQAGFAYPRYNGGQFNSLCQYLGFWYEFGVGNGCATQGGSPLGWADGSQVSGVTFGQNAATATGILRPYYFPSSPSDRPEFYGMAPGIVDGVWNDGSIIKLQYQKNIGSNAYLRVLGYTFYSDWLQNDPNGAANYTGLAGIGFDGAAPDYELNTHTRGMQLQFADQINSQHLLTLTGNYTTSSVLRNNNVQPFFTASTTPFAILENASGQCYSYIDNNPDPSKKKTPPLYDPSYGSGATAGTPVSCLSFLAGQTLDVANAGALPAIPAAAAAAGAKWTAAANIAPNANVNQVVPSFFTASLQDDWKPTDRLDLTLGLRLESYGYDFTNNDSPEAEFWFNQINETVCVDPRGLTQVAASTRGGQDPTAAQHGFETWLTTSPGGACPIGKNGDQLYHPGQGGVPIVEASSDNSLTKVTSSPRIGGTYTFSQDTVARFTYGRYVQPTETAFEQVLTYEDGYQLATSIYGSQYYNNGFNSTVHDNPLQYSNNADFSIEQRIHGTDMTMRATPFYRYTSDQLVTIALPGGLSGGFNAATQQTKGLEFAFEKGDPTKNGFSGQLSYTYTDAKLKYSLVNGTNTIDVLRNNLATYYALTQAARAHGNTKAAPCYSPSGDSTPMACSNPEAIVNPYYGALPASESLNQFLSSYPVDGWYPTYGNFFPTSVGGGDDTATALSPNIFAGFLTYHRNRFTATLNGIMEQGSLYGSPVDIAGIDPRYCYGNEGKDGILPGSQLADYQTCSAQVPIPNPQTGQFDSIGAFHNPWQINLGLQFEYVLTPRITATMTLANVLNTCFGGSAEAWTAAYKPGNLVCGYAVNSTYLDWSPNAANIAGAGYYYGSAPTAAVNGTAGYPNVFNQAYSPVSGGVPFQAYVQLQVKL